MAEWMLREVADGLQRLVALAIPGQPPAETIALTAAAWCEALEASSIAWDEHLDAPRLRMSFRALMRDCERWPQPAHLLRALPARPELIKLPPPPMTAEQKQRARAMLADIVRKMEVKP
jgi:hypothetical protein